MNLARLMFSEDNTENVILELIEASRDEVSPEIFAGEFAARKLIDGSGFTDLESALYDLQDRGAEFDLQSALEIAEDALEDMVDNEGYHVFLEKDWFDLEQ